jgi:hypothetical protein
MPERWRTMSRVLTDHAADRFRERIMPLPDRRIVAMLRAGTLRQLPPLGCHPATDADCYVDVGRGYFVMHEARGRLVAVTTVRGRR